MTDTARDILTPTQLNTLARDLLEGAFPLVWVEGELGNVTRPASGHLYFTLKDARAQVRCAMFKPKSQWLKFAPREGLRVLARGRLTLYEARGDYQLVIDSLEEAGEGALRRAFEELRARLTAEGLFDDMLQRAARSGRYDVLLVARGGGSLEDLWAFNDERLARAIAASPVPVVSAIGHETDFTLADFAADLRAPTPSVAAELLVPDRRDLLARVQALQRRLATTQAHRLRNAMQRADRAALRLHALRPQARLEMLRRRQEDAARRLHALWRDQQARRQAALRHADAVLRAHAPRRRLEQLRARLLTLAPRPQAAVARTLQRDALRLRALARSLEAVSPLATVARGYALITKEDGTLVRSVAQVQPGERVDAQVGDGRLTLRVES